MRMHRTHGIGIALVCCVLAASAEGQGAKPGDRVRVVQLPGKQVLVRGTMVRLSADSAVILSDTSALAGDGPTVTIAITGDNRLQRFAGMKRRIAAGMGIGLLLGATTGGIVGAQLYQPKDCSRHTCGFEYNRDGYTRFGAVIGGAAGVLIGGIVGSTRTHEVWRPVSGLPIQLAIAPTADRSMLLAARVSF